MTISFDQTPINWNWANYPQYENVIQWKLLQTIIAKLHYDAKIHAYKPLLKFSDYVKTRADVYFTRDTFLTKKRALKSIHRVYESNNSSETRSLSLVNWRHVVLKGFQIRKNAWYDGTLCGWNGLVVINKWSWAKLKEWKYIQNDRVIDEVLDQISPALYFQNLECSST